MMRMRNTAGRRLVCLLALAAAMVVPAFGEEAVLPVETAAVEEPNAVQAAAPKFTVKVTRAGRMLNIQYAAESGNGQEALLRSAAPTIEIYMGDRLLESGSFAFG